MNAHPHDHDGQPGTRLHPALQRPYHHARHYIGWARDVEARVAEHRAGAGSPLIRAALAAGVRVELAATMPGSRFLERRLERWHKTGQFCPRCRAARGGKGSLTGWHARIAVKRANAPTPRRPARDAMHHFADGLKPRHRAKTGQPGLRQCG